MMKITRKTKKAYIIACWLHEAMIRLGAQRLQDVQALVYSLRINHMEDGFDHYHCRWNLNDGYKIAKESKIPLPVDKLAIRILMGLRERIPTAQEMGLRRCSSCHRELSLKKFSGYQKYCRSCRNFYNFLNR